MTQEPQEYDAPGIRFEPCSLADHPELTFSTAKGCFEDIPNSPTVVLVRFDGWFEHDSTWMSAVLRLAETAWRPSAVIVDVRGMYYEWGDAIGAIGGDHGIRKYLVVSARCRAGLTSFIECEWGCDPAEWLFDSIEAALGQCRADLIGAEPDRDGVSRLDLLREEITDKRRSDAESCQDLRLWVWHHPAGEVRAMTTVVEKLLTRFGRELRDSPPASS
jgi:hypothetical protein